MKFILALTALALLGCCVMLIAGVLSGFILRDAGYNLFECTCAGVAIGNGFAASSVMSSVNDEGLGTRRVLKIAKTQGRPRLGWENPTVKFILVLVGLAIGSATVIVSHSFEYGWLLGRCVVFIAGVLFGFALRDSGYNLFRMHLCRRRNWQSVRGKPCDEQCER